MTSLKTFQGKCPFCNSLLINSSSNSQKSCPDKKCRFHQFVKGNRVIHLRRPELGVGEIIKIKYYQKNVKSDDYGWISTTFAAIEGQKNNIHSQDNEKYQKFVVNFQAYHEKQLYLHELRHYLWHIGDKITTQNEVGTVTNRRLHDSSGLIVYEIMTDRKSTRLNSSHYS